MGGGGGIIDFHLGKLINSLLVRMGKLRYILKLYTGANSTMTLFDWGMCLGLRRSANDLVSDS